METFKVEIQELLSRTIDIKAQNIEEAIEKVTGMYNSEEIVLDYDDFKKREIIPFELMEEKANLTKEIIGYLYREEKKHFEELDEPNDHIFLKLQRLKTLID
ncbi:DpnD/PcfM family protein [Flavobacterium sp. CBA20B-1]|uniref:DpnD/PcfM family protein n=1 Tax=unclassified Flavobacterium TaxID=196869 RepID=UPI0022246839|nr:MULTISPECIES: DpnD/PcfM family protein [unclassified Flavobacterium]WCM42908.1 DpnD/PcfM family protein [Flavobacterium sp. CBA20B-1]